MKRGTTNWNATAPWAGWIGGAVGWFLSQQSGSSIAQASCSHAAAPMFVLDALGAALAFAGLVVSLGAARSSSDTTTRFIGVTAAGASGLFLFAIVLQAAAALIIPRCAT